MNFLKKFGLLYIPVFIFFQSCYKDDSLLAGKLTEALHVSGVSNSFVVDNNGGELNITPTITGENKQDYAFTWLLYDAAFNGANPILPTADTLSRIEVLKYKFNQANTGEYLLVLHALNKKNNIAQLFKYKVTITTRNFSGWYILKEENGKSDLDFYYNGGKVENWIAFNNEGKSLEGKAKKAFWVPKMKNTVQSKEDYSALTVLTDKDVALFKLETGKKLLDYETIFFDKPSTKRLQNLLLGMNQNLLLVNDGKYYLMQLGSKFGSTSPNNFEIGDLGVAASINLLFDTKSKSIFLNDGSNTIDLSDNFKELKNMTEDLYWTEANRGTRNTATLIFKNNNTGEGKFFQLNTSYGAFFYGSPKLITQNISLPEGHDLLNADVINGNYDNDVLYLGNENKLYYMSIPSFTSVLQKTFDPGEVITCIQHIKYPAPSTGVINTFNKVAVATYKDGKYKVWISNINSTGGLVFKAEPDFEGKGKVNSFTYFENGNGNFLYR